MPAIAEPFVALHGLRVPGAMVYGYQAGDPVSDRVVEAWGLVVGEDVRPVHTGAVGRPSEDGTRADWEAYAIGQGWSREDAVTASIDDLRAIPEPEPDEHGNPPAPEPLPDTDAPRPRPADSARKAEWVLYVNDHPQATAEDQAWASDDTTTKVDLQAWEPATGGARPADASGDPVAESASDLANR